jgi:hypothetical protein
MTVLSCSKIKVTFLIPLYNEKESIDELYKSIICEVNSLEIDYEILFIDDGSTDGSFGIVRSLSAQDPSVKGIRLRRNFGKSAALNKGFRVAKGDVVITLDADLQDDPKEISRFISKLNEGYDLVTGWKKKRKDPFLSKNLPSKLFNLMVRCTSGVKLHDFNCGFKAFRRHVVENLYLYGDLHRFIPALVHSQGYKVIEIPVEHHARRYGNSKYGLSRFTHGFLDFLTVIVITKYLKRPMHFFGGLGALVSLVGFGCCLYLSILWFMGEVIGRRPLLTLGVLLIIVGMQMMMTGLIAEMRSYDNRNIDNDDIVVEWLGLESL